MAKFHVNPKTGNPSTCRATEKRGCPYEGLSDHYETLEEARQAYELKQESIQSLMANTNVPQVQGSFTIAVSEPESFTSSFDDNNFTKAMDKIPSASLLVFEDGTIFQKSGHPYDDRTWTLRSKYLPELRLEENKSYDRSYISRHLRTHRARLETAPKVFYPQTRYLAGLGRQPQS